LVLKISLVLSVLRVLLGLSGVRKDESGVPDSKFSEAKTKQQL